MFIIIMCCQPDCFGEILLFHWGTWNYSSCSLRTEGLPWERRVLDFSPFYSFNITFLEWMSRINLSWWFFCLTIKLDKGFNSHNINNVSPAVEKYELWTHLDFYVLTNCDFLEFHSFTTFMDPFTYWLITELSIWVEFSNTWCYKDGSS